MNNLGFAKIYTAAKIQNLRNERNVRKNCIFARKFQVR